MHIAFLTPEYPHQKIKSSGGLGTSIKNLVDALVQQNIMVSVFVYGQNTQETFEENGVTFHFIANKNYKIGKWYFYRKHIQKYVNSIIIKDKIDVLEVPDWTGVSAFMKFSISVVMRFHGSDTYFCHLENRKQKLKNFWFEKLATKSAKAFIAPTEFAGKLSAKLFNIQEDKVTTIHYGLNLDYFQNLKPNNFQSNLIVYVGTIIRKKGVFELAEIFNIVIKNNPKAQLVLIGSDSFDIQTNTNSTWKLVEEKFSKEAIKSVNYIGKIPYSEVKEFIKKANVCVFPTFAETLGMVTLEAMAMQKPVVNSNIGWANELIEDGVSGYLVHPTNHELFASRIIEILNNDYLTLQIGNKAIERVISKFDINTVVKQNISFHKKLI